MEPRFLIVGAPGMGKTTLLAKLPTIICRATCIDLENCQSPCDREFLHRLTSSILLGNWQNPIFFGNAAADACQLAELGLSIIALHCPYRDRYLEQMKSRDRQYRQASQGDAHWEYHRELFEETMTKRNIQPFMLDSVTMNEDEAIRAIASYFDLKLWTNQVVWITGPRGAGKTSTAVAFSSEACAVDTDRLLNALNEIVPPEFRYGIYQSTQGYQRIPSTDFGGFLRKAWAIAKKSPRENCPLVVAGWHVREPWLRSVILNTFAKGQNVVEFFHLLQPSLDVLVTNIRHRNDAMEIQTHCGETGVQSLRQTQIEFDELCVNWQVHDDATCLLEMIANEIGCRAPAKPNAWR